MGGLSAETDANWESFGVRWLSTLVAIVLRTVRDPAVALDLATETLAAARTLWDDPSAGERGLVDVIGLAARILARAVERGRVPATERRRYGLAPYRLTLDQQRELVALSEHPLDLAAEPRQAAEALARSAPPPSALRELRCSDLVEADPLPDHERRPDGA
jgi:hypothetical protein